MSSLTGVSNHLLQGNNPVGSTIIQSKEGDDARSTDAAMHGSIFGCIQLFYLNFAKTKRKFNKMFQLIFQQ
jgi:hypothetical protein